jgi:hypothetical protein
MLPGYKHIIYLVSQFNLYMCNCPSTITTTTSITTGATTHTYFQTPTYLLISSLVLFFSMSILLYV